MKTKEKVEQEQRSLLNVNDFFKKIIIVGDNIKRLYRKITVQFFCRQIFIKKQAH